jgi:hypothetical protein
MGITANVRHTRSPRPQDRGFRNNARARWLLSRLVEGPRALSELWRADSPRIPHRPAAAVYLRQEIAYEPVVLAGLRPVNRMA